jgi:RWD domain
MNEILDCELEALRDTFDGVTVTEREGCQSISMRLQPYRGDDDVFVEAGLNFSLDHLYPESTPEVWIDTPKGLSDERLQKIMVAIKESAIEFTGEPVLMTMCMAAKDALSLMNFPEGVASVPFR